MLIALIIVTFLLGITIGFISAVAFAIHMEDRQLAKKAAMRRHPAGKGVPKENPFVPNSLN